ncbi:MAG: HlyC/CorC family transporter [Paludibacter sp.]|nr:HlyC/CorC family transporter [Paludibacter sp.]
MEVIIIIALILLNGIFSMSEMSLVSARKFKLESAKKKGSKGAKTALELSENPTRFLSTVQIGITLIGILLGVYSGESMTKDVEQYLAHFEQLSPYAHNLAVVIIVIGVTYLSIVLGELLPKRLGLTFPEPIAIFLAKPMKVLSVITSPFVWLLTISNDILIKILGITSTMDSKVSEEEIKSIIKESAEGGEIQDIEQDIVERVFEFGDKKVNSLFTHKNDIVFFDETDDLQTVRQKITAEKHSAYPVCTDNDIDKVVGIVLLKDLFTPSIEDNFNLRDFIKEPLFLTESTFAYSLLEKFKTIRMHYAIVVDEYGSTKGIVTMDDVVDALIGDVTEHNQHEYQITVRDENSWFVDGQYSFTEFLHYFDIDMEEEMDGNFVTIAGFFIHKFNNLPNIGDKLNIDAYRLEIIDKDGQRIDKILVTKRI